MSKKKIVFVCFDEDYITALEYKMAEIVGHNAEIEFITDCKFYTQYMSVPKRIDILVVPENMGQMITNKSNIGKIYYLTEENVENNKESEDLVYKYGSVRYLVEKIDEKIFENTGKDGKKGTKVVSVFSVGGGCGKTTAALSVAHNLHKKGNRVLYVSTQPMQDYQFVIPNCEKLSSEFSYQCTINIKNALKLLLREIKTEGFDYIPAFNKIPSTYQVTFETYVDMIEFINQKNMYDYIIVELSNSISTKKNSFMHNCYRTLIVTTQEETAVKKLENFLESMAGFTDKVTILCNRVKTTRTNYLEVSPLVSTYEISEYVSEGETGISFQTIKDYQCFNRTTVCLE
ncbi:MAG: hypothetical protein E7257_03445 [Lachnospiraceae bacterium]|nr:hypothetical protein [Lachnospiraceae bacterium]MBQ9935590.1 AAA family ATPase [Lachnospiraceae bacterium]